MYVGLNVKEVVAVVVVVVKECVASGLFSRLFQWIILVKWYIIYWVWACACESTSNRERLRAHTRNTHSATKKNNLVKERNRMLGCRENFAALFMWRIISLSLSLSVYYFFLFTLLFLKRHAYKGEMGWSMHHVSLLSLVYKTIWKGTIFISNNDPMSGALFATFDSCAF